MKERIKDLATIYKAYSDPTRLMIVKILASEAAEKPCVLDLAGMLNVTSAAVSQHMRILKSINVVDSERKANQVFYSLNLNVMHSQKQLIDEMFDIAFKKCDMNC